MIDLDKVTVSMECPKCRFLNDVSLKEVRLRDARLCRGCHEIIRFEDSMNTVRKAVRSANAALAELAEAFSGSFEINLTF